jgi:hypothetical protein
MSLPHTGIKDTQSTAASAIMPQTKRPVVWIGNHVAALVFLALFCVLPLCTYNQPDYFLAKLASWKNKATHSTGSELTRKPTGGSAAPYAVFWNLYFANGANAVQMANTTSAAKEQLHQIGSAFAAMALSQPATLYYNTIGDRSLGGFKNTTFIDALCSQYYDGYLKCQHMEHFDRGFEEVTLNKLYDYCQDDESDDDRASHIVAYVHNKGSHHPGGYWDAETQAQVRQDCWRRSGTAAAVSELCLKPANDDCNVCSLLWTPVPWQHVSSIATKLICHFYVYDVAAIVGKHDPVCLPCVCQSRLTD